jgi:hypothetical protein
MRITLSYFIEPGPGEIGWKNKCRYPSHGLRFHLNSPGESKDEFVDRINKTTREDEKEGGVCLGLTLGQYFPTRQINSDTT